MACQSGRNVLALAGVLAAAPALAGPVSWAHQAGAVQSNGAVTVKSLSGGSYNGARNPSGAVAKANQNAVTQPPTVIIQATAQGYTEVQGLGVSTQVPPACPTGYNRVFTAFGNGCDSVPKIFNIAGTRMSLYPVPAGSVAYAMFVPDGMVSFTFGGNAVPIWGGGALCTVTGVAQDWAVSLCSK